MQSIIKSSIYSLLLGAIIVFLIGSFLLAVSLDMRLMAVVGIILLVVGSYWRGDKYLHGMFWVQNVLIVMPFSAFYWMVIKDDLPSLWFLIPIMYVASLFGYLIAKLITHTISLISATIALIAITVFLIPLFVSEDLTEFTEERVAPFEMVDHEGTRISSSDLLNKTVVFDFYGTWCKPCIAEIPELAKVKQHFSSNDQVVFFIVNSDQGGDNLEKAKKFAKEFDFGFTYVYDEGQKVYKSLGLSGSGVPSILILDKEGTIRLRHTGYNKSETDFVKNMIANIESISQF